MLLDLYRQGAGEVRVELPRGEDPGSQAVEMDLSPRAASMDAGATGRIESVRGGETTRPEPYGLFPMDESPYGVRDMAGGVQEWADPLATARCKVKGGGWCMDMPNCRAASRDIGPATFATPRVGLRLAADRVSK